MKLEFMPQAMETFQRIKSQSPDIYEKLRNAIKDTLEHPESGIGNPTSLEGSYKGLWERRVSFEDGFYYAFDSDRLVILGFSSSERVHRFLSPCASIFKRVTKKSMWT